MAKPKTRRVAAGAGWAMLAVFLTTFGIRFTDLNEHHSKELNGVLMASGLVLLTALGFWFFTKDDSDALPTTPNEVLSQTTHGANSPIGGGPRSTTAGGDIRQITTEHYYEAANVTPPIPPPPLEQPEEKAELDFDVKPEWVWLVYENAPGCWRKSTPSDPSPGRSFIVHFTRNEPPKGGKTRTTISLVAILKFTFSTGSEQVSRAYWLERNSNQIDFEAGHQEAVVVGRCEGPLFSSYLNKFTFDASYGLFMPVVRGVGDRKTMHTAGPILVKISLFDVNANKTVEVKQFELLFSKSTVSAKEVT